MERFVFKKLTEWKNSKDRKPLILQGARQVGKTWIMKEFGKRFFDNYVYFNFDEDNDLKELFKVNKSAERLIERLSLVCGQDIKPEKTLIIFDEIQECSDALNSLKYFNENAKEYCVISAGSLLGTLLAQPKSYPVGQVNKLNIYPLNFEEFLKATDETLYKCYQTIAAKDGTFLESIFTTKFKEAYQNYLIVGGLPECVESWIKYKDAKKVAEIQDELVTLYENDFGKHNGKVNSGRILMVFRNIVPQLSKENKKFIYGKVQEGARARDFEEAIEWLVSAGMINRVYQSSNPQHPLKVYDELNAFKLYLFDTGLLKHMAGIDNASIVLEKDFQFKGALTENFVLQQIKETFDVEPRYFTFGRYETDFVVQDGSEIYPIEVKSNTSVNSPSLKAYREKYQPIKAIRYSMLNYKDDDNLINIPLYLVGKTKDLI